MVVTKLISETVVLLVNLTAPGSRTNALIRAAGGLQRQCQSESLSQSLVTADHYCAQWPGESQGQSQS